MWLKLDDAFVDHPKLALLGDLQPLAGWLHVCAMCYSARHLTDGFIPKGTVRTLASFENLYVETGGDSMVAMGHDVETEHLVSALVECGLWHLEGRGYRIHDFLDYNPSREQIESRRVQKSTAGKKGASSRWSTSAIAPDMTSATEKASAMAPVKQSGITGCDAPVPVPLPPCDSKTESHAARVIDDEPGSVESLANRPPCLSAVVNGRTAWSLLVDTLAEAFGASWPMKPVNVGKFASAITAGCPEDCDGSKGLECAKRFDADILDCAEKGRADGKGGVGLLLYRLRNREEL